MLKGTLRDAAGVLLLLLCLGAATVVVLSPTKYRAGFDSVLAVWADFVRDADHIGLAVTRIPAAEEMRIGEAMAAQFRVEEQIGTPLANYVGSVGSHLVALGGVRRTDIAYHFHVLANSHLANAWALPGGQIFITTGMLAMIGNEAQLAAVLSHEIAHVDLSHTVERLQYEAAMQRVVGDVAQLGRIAYGLINVAYSSQEESEADRAGALMMARARYSPVEAIVLFRAMQAAYERPGTTSTPAGPFGELTGSIVSALRDYFRTHPPFADRIADLRQLIADNAPAWSDRTFCVGAGNLRDLISCMDERRHSEWVTLDTSSLQ